MPPPAALYEMPSPFEEGAGERLLLLEPASASMGELQARLLDGSYDKPFIVDDGEWRRLHFDAGLVQSAMRLAAPNALDVRYTQKMMSFLLFQPKPRRILLVGLGGGSLVKFCHARLPSTPLTVVENNADVIALRDAFFLPADGPCLEVVQADGADYLAKAAKGIDVLLLDAFDRRGYAPSLADADFFAQAKAKLAGNGVLVINLAGDPQAYAGVVGLAAETFAGQVVLVPVREDDNQLLLAFRDGSFTPDWRRLRSLARELRGKYGLDFPAFLHKIESSARMDLARREAGRGR